MNPGVNPMLEALRSLLVGCCLRHLDPTSANLSKECDFSPSLPYAMQSNRFVSSTQKGTCLTKCSRELKATLRSRHA